MSTTDSDLTALFLDSSRKLLFGQHWPRMKTCVESLTTEQIWWRPNDASNSIGNLLLHLNGNVRQWLVTSFNQAKTSAIARLSSRPRKAAPRQSCWTELGATLDEAAAVLDRLTPADLLAHLRGPGLSRERRLRRLPRHRALRHALRPDCLHHQVLSGKDLGFYKELRQDRPGRKPKISISETSAASADSRPPRRGHARYALKIGREFGVL